MGLPAIAFQPLMNYISCGDDASGGGANCRATQASGRRFAALPADGLRGTRLPVRKCLTKKSGIVGLPPCGGHDSLDDGGEFEGPG
jgi:hypothetical protein